MSRADKLFTKEDELKAAGPFQTAAVPPDTLKLKLLPAQTVELTGVSVITGTGLIIAEPSPVP